jgi:hypothetical protein
LSNSARELEEILRPGFTDDALAGGGYPLLLWITLLAFPAAGFASQQRRAAPRIDCQTGSAADRPGAVLLAGYAGVLC